MIWLSGLIIWLSIIMLVATFNVGGSGLLPYAPRVFILPIAAGLGFIFLKQLDLSRAIVIPISRLILIYALFMAYQSACYYLDGMHLTEVLRKTSSTHLLALMGFLAILPLAIFDRSRNIIATVCAVVIGFSLVFALMQWLNIDIAWHVAAEMNERFVRLWNETTPGLAMNSVSLGYQLLLIAPVVIYFATVSDRRLKVLRWMCAVGLPLLLFPIQSRSVSISFLLILATVLCFSFRGIKLFSLDRLRTLMIIILSAISIFSTVTSTGAKLVHGLVNPYSLNQTIKSQVIECDCDLKSVEVNSSKIRVMAIGLVISSIESPSDFLFGPGTKKYNQKMPNNQRFIYPHNLIFNALLINGALGLAMVMYVYWSIFTLPQPIWSYFKDKVLFLSGLGLMAQLFNSMFHNDSLNHGSIYPWLIAAFIFGRTIQFNLNAVTSQGDLTCAAK